MGVASVPPYPPRHMPGEAIEEEARERLGIDQQASDHSRLWWAAGAILIGLLIVDFFSFLSLGISFSDYVGWFFLGFTTALFVAATAVLLPRRATQIRTTTR